MATYNGLFGSAASAGEAHGRLGKRPAPPTRTNFFDSRTEAQIAREVAEYNSSYSAALLYQLAKRR